MKNTARAALAGLGVAAALASGVALGPGTADADDETTYLESDPGRVVFTDPKIGTDINGKTYAEAGCRVLGKRLNSDLAKLGY